MKGIDDGAVGSLDDWEWVVGVDTLLLDAGLGSLDGKTRLKVLVTIFLAVRENETRIINGESI